MEESFDAGLASVRAATQAELTAALFRADRAADSAKQAQLFLNTARAKARGAVEKMEKAQRKVAKVERKLATALESHSSESDEEEEVVDEEAAVALPFDVLPRRDEMGRFQAESVEVRSLRYAQVGRGVAPSTVSHNIQDVLALIAPDVQIPSLSAHVSNLLRGEVTIAGEAMAAWKFAIAVRIISFG